MASIMLSKQSSFDTCLFVSRLHRLFYTTFFFGILERTGKFSQHIYIMKNKNLIMTKKHKKKNCDFFSKEDSHEKLI